MLLKELLLRNHNGGNQEEVISIMSFHEKTNEYPALAQLVYGVELDVPHIMIPWSIREREFCKKYITTLAKKVTNGAYIIKNATFLGEENCNIGIEFKQTMFKVGLSRSQYNSYDDVEKSFISFQNAFEKAYGKATAHMSDVIGFYRYEWIIDVKLNIHHYIMDRFGLAEYLYIERI